MAEELKRKLYELLHELPQRQGEVEQLQQHLSLEQLSKQELLSENESLKVEVSSLRAQLELTTQVLYKCEENYNRARDSSVNHRLSLEAMSRGMDKMKAQAIQLHTENRMLKKKVEEQEKEIKAESFSRESCIAKHSKMQTTIESLTAQMHSLEKDLRDLEKTSNRALSTGKQSKLLIDNKELTIKKLKKKNEELSTEVVTLTSESKAIKLSVKEKKPVEHPYVEEILKEWQNSQNEMKARIQHHEQESESLRQSLQRSLGFQTRFQKLEAAAVERVRQLEAQLEESKKKEGGILTSTTDLKAIDVGCQTTGVEVNNAGTQSDYVDLQNPCPLKGDPGTQRYSSTSVSQLLSRMETERAKLQLSQSQDISELETQPGKISVVKNNN